MVSRLAPLVVSPAPTINEWSMYVADGLVPIAAIDTFEEATIIGRFNAISSWTLTLPTDTEGCQALVTAARPRLVISTREGTVFRSGPPIDFERTVDGDSDMTTITGVDDLVWLARRVTHPQPGSAAPPYSTTAYDVRTGPVSQVIAAYVNANAGPGAIPRRQVPDLTVPTPSPMGHTVTRRLRWLNLLDQMVLLADGAGLGIEIVDLEFRVFTPTGTARFSTDLGTLAGFTAAATAPERNYVYAGGTGEGTARLIVEGSHPSMSTWGLFEGFLDQRSESSQADLLSRVDDALVDGSPPPIVEIQAIETEGQRFGVDWGLGSVARVWLDPGGEPLEEVIRQVTIELRGNTPPSIRPSLGGAVGIDLWKALARTDSRIRNLEVR